MDDHDMSPDDKAILAFLFTIPVLTVIAVLVLLVFAP